MTQSNANLGAVQSKLWREEREKNATFFQAASVESREHFLRVVVFDTVDIVLHIYSEGHPVQTFFTHHTAEAAWMVGLAQRLEDLHHHIGKHARSKTEAMEIEEG